MREEGDREGTVVEDDGPKKERLSDLLQNRRT